MSQMRQERCWMVSETGVELLWDDERRIKERKLFTY
jgi:hypothetical protein